MAHTAHRQDFAGVPLLTSMYYPRDLARSEPEGVAAQTVDILHGHGLWLMPNVYPAWAVRRGGAKWVVSPRGMLGSEALAFSPIKKRAFWRLFQARALGAAALLHATGEGEYADIRAAGLGNPVAIIPNGVDVPPAGPGPRDDAPTVLSLGRIHPKKGLASLVRAWASIEAEVKDWRLRIVGPAELGHDRELAALGGELGVQRMSIQGPLFGDEHLPRLSLGQRVRAGRRSMTTLP